MTWAGGRAHAETWVDLPAVRMSCVRARTAGVSPDTGGGARAGLRAARGTRNDLPAADARRAGPGEKAHAQQARTGLIPLQVGLGG